MFVFKRSAAAVLLPLILLVAVVTWSNLPAGDGSAAPAQTARTAQASLHPQGN